MTPPAGTHADEQATSERAAPADRAAAPALGGPSASRRLLALQRTAGNRAVGAVLARQAAPAAAPAPAAATVTDTTDPRLHYHASGVPRAGVDAAPLPSTNPREPLSGWNWMEILTRLSQHDESAFTFSD